METLEQVVAAHPFFQGLDAQQIKIVASCAYNAHFDAGDYVFREGEEAKTVYIIREGEVVLEAPRPGKPAVEVQTIAAGSVLGWSWLFPPHRWRFDARATKWTRTIALDAACLKSKCQANHDLGYELLKRFAAIVVERLQATRMRWLADQE
ncbi:MAG: cyclic nucleotide-binding domain-containing protein [Chthonomonadales bacterium]